MFSFFLNFYCQLNILTNYNDYIQETHLVTNDISSVRNFFDSAKLILFLLAYPPLQFCAMSRKSFRIIIRFWNKVIIVRKKQFFFVLC